MIHRANEFNSFGGKSPCKSVEMRAEKVFIVFYQYILMWKSIKIKEKTKKELDKLKIHPRQSYDEVIMNLVKKCKKR